MEENLKKTSIWQSILSKPYFFGAVFFYWITSGILLILFSKREIHLFLNAYHTSFGDMIFPWLTRLGEEWIYIFIGLVFLYKKNYRALIATGITLIVQTILVQSLKHLLFPLQPRPNNFFAGENVLNFVEGVDVHSILSFPSGHTATAFSAFCLVVFFHKHPLWQILGFIGAVSVAVSRMYLQQHFFIDTLAGSCLGILAGLVGFYWYSKN
jgi:membrane-associated phospholipid phosphatase